MDNEYIICNKTNIEERIVNLENRKKTLDIDDFDGFNIISAEISVLKSLIKQSTPLIPEIKKAFTIGQNKGAFHMKRQFRTGELTFADSSDYISKLKLDI